jgi:choline-glycine betaine transporter
VQENANKKRLKETLNDCKSKDPRVSVVVVISVFVMLFNINAAEDSGRFCIKYMSTRQLIKSTSMANQVHKTVSR